MHESAKLVEKVKNGDRNAFWHLMSQYESMIYKFCFRKLLTKEKAEDAARDALIKSFDKIKSLKDNNKFKSWLYTIARNVCIDELKKANRFTDPSEDNDLDIMPGNSTSPEDVVENANNSERIKKELNNFTDIHREVLILVHYQGLSYEETADVLGISQGTVKSRLFRALASMRENLKDINN